MTEKGGQGAGNAAGEDSPRVFGGRSPMRGMAALTALCAVAGSLAISSGNADAGVTLLLLLVALPALVFFLFLRGVASFTFTGAELTVQFMNGRHETRSLANCRLALEEAPGRNGPQWRLRVRGPEGSALYPCPRLSATGRKELDEFLAALNAAISRAA